MEQSDLVLENARRESYFSSSASWPYSVLHRENGYISQPNAIPTNTNMANDHAAYFTRSIGFRRPSVPNASEMISANSSND
jgi:hypothetical protein